MSQDFIFKQADKKIPLTKANLIKHNILDETKVHIFWHPAKRKIVVAAKLSGKTFPVKIKEIMTMENNKFASTFDFLKYKDAASTKLGNAFSYAVSILNQSNFNIGVYEKSTNVFYRVLDKKNRLNNQSQNYGSIQVVTATDGAYPSNGGFYKIKHVDEPIVKEDMIDPTKIPSVEDFKEDMAHIDDNLERFNRAYQNFKGLDKAPSYESIYTMNDFGKHPLSLECQEFYPREKFLDEILGIPFEKLIGNSELIKKIDWEAMKKKHTLARYAEDEDNPDVYHESRLVLAEDKNEYQKVGDKLKIEWNGTLYVRMTKFANPIEREPKRFAIIRSKIERALFSNNSAALARLLGSGFDTKIGLSMKSFNIQNYRVMDSKKFMEEHYITGVSYGIDTDTSRVITISPELLGQHKKTRKVRTHTMAMGEIKCNGLGEFGEGLEPLAVQINSWVKKHILANAVNFQLVKRKYMIVDDFRKEFLRELHKLRDGTITTYAKAKKLGKDSLMARQIIVQYGAENDICTISNKNQDLIEDYKECIRADESSPLRKTKGSTNYLDRIDARDYGLQPFIEQIYRKRR